MADYSQKFAASPSTVTVTLTSLADTSGVASSAIDNSTNAYIDCDLEVKTNGTTGSVDLLEVYILSSVDNTDFTDSANAVLVGVVDMNDSTAVKKTFRIFDLPKYFKFRFVNNSGAALSATAGDHAVSYLGIKYTDA